MNEIAVTSLTYVWHYVLARLIYDHLVRPLGRPGSAQVLLALGWVVAGAFLVRRWTRRRQR